MYAVFPLVEGFLPSLEGGVFPNIEGFSRTLSVSTLRRGRGFHTHGRFLPYFGGLYRS